MSKQVIVDYIPFEVSPQQINESIKDNNGRLIVKVSKHLTSVIDGVINDTYDPSRNATRCVYGYYIKQ